MKAVLDSDVLIDFLQGNEKDQARLILLFVDGS